LKKGSQEALPRRGLGLRVRRCSHNSE
jgi:hypothetical protein